jgi:hypothetical protein
MAATKVPGGWHSLPSLPGTLTQVCDQRRWDQWDAPMLAGPGHTWQPGRRPWRRPDVCRRSGCRQPAADAVLSLCPACWYRYVTSRLAAKWVTQ